ncbi:uncharacterized protein P884DRAFT_239682 [Thermothelomyces heterothallicus CBS 202.75]|uniref:uncharacterized protein n=1 Tax=Thermothelomyces heterothallicus CBS 202.75 TaxID=1149848 RepID=UPI003743A357
MGRLGPMTSLGLGRSPYDEVVPGEGPEDPRAPRQQYDERGRPINPETKRINRDVIRSHNEVMMVIGVAEPENSLVDAQAEAAREQQRYEDRVGRTLLLYGGVLNTAAIWGVNGMRQRILLYKPYSQTTFYGMFRMAWSRQSLGPYLFGGLPSFLVSTLLEQLPALGVIKKTPLTRYATAYIRLHLAIYAFFQRTGVVPFRNWLPNWRFFVPGSSLSPICLPPAPTSFRLRGILQWLGAFALAAAPFAGFYLYTKFYTILTRALRYTIHQRLPRPYNSSKRRRDWAPLSREDPDFDFVEQQIDENPPTTPPTTTTNTTTTTTTTPITTDPSPSAVLRRQSTISLRGRSGSNNNNNNADQPAPAQDDFASEDEDTDIISATLISFDVEATDPTSPDAGPHSSGSNAANHHNHTGGDATPGVWSAELRPSLADGSRSGGAAGLPGSGASGRDPLYRETVLTRLPAILATDVLAITPARLAMLPFAVSVWLGLTRPYMARMGMPLEGVLEGAGRWWGLSSARGLVNMLGLELLLAVMQGEAWAVIMLAAERYRISEEEWRRRVEAQRGEREERI